MLNITDIKHNSNFLLKLSIVAEKEIDKYVVLYMSIGGHLLFFLICTLEIF
jgi:hypothetical protein